MQLNNNRNKPEVSIFRKCYIIIYRENKIEQRRGV